MWCGLSSPLCTSGLYLTQTGKGLFLWELCSRKSATLGNGRRVLYLLTNHYLVLALVAFLPESQSRKSWTAWSFHLNICSKDIGSILLHLILAKFGLLLPGALVSAAAWVHAPWRHGCYRGAMAWFQTKMCSRSFSYLIHEMEVTKLIFLLRVGSSDLQSWHTLGSLAEKQPLKMFYYICYCLKKTHSLK